MAGAPTAAEMLRQLHTLNATKCWWPFGSTVVASDASHGITRVIIDGVL